MVSEVHIREATIHDIDVLVKHRRRMFEDMGNGDAPALTEMQAGAKEYFGKALRDGSYRGWLAESGAGVIAGGGIVISHWPAHPEEPRPRRAMILNMYTEPEYRRRGIARRLMNTMLAWLREQGFASVALHASLEGRPLYESLGFQPTNEMRLNFPLL
jgi:GNAT superfamily N-acetyltransferase